MARKKPGQQNRKRQHSIANPSPPHSRIRTCNLTAHLLLTSLVQSLPGGKKHHQKRIAKPDLPIKGQICRTHRRLLGRLIAQLPTHIPRSAALLQHASINR